MEASAAWFTPEQGRELWQDYLRRKQLPAQQTQNFPQRRLIDEPSPHRVFVYNTTGETIPAYACMRVVGTRDINNITAVDVEKPTSTEGAFLFNSQFPIAVPSATESGVGWAYRFGNVVMLGDPPSQPSVQYSPIVGSWLIEEGSGPFVVYGTHRADPYEGLLGTFGTGSGGGHTIWFTIESVLCPETDYVDETTLVVTAEWYNQSCTGTPPGATYEGTYEVYDICNYLDGLTPTDLVGTRGRATYHYPLTGYCEPRWLIDDLCAQPECA